MTIQLRSAARIQQAQYQAPYRCLVTARDQVCATLALCRWRKIAVDPVLLDVRARVLLLTVSRLTSRFEINLPDVLRLVAGTDIRIRFDPVNGNPCIAFEDIRELLSTIRPRKNDRHNRKNLSMLLEHSVRKKKGVGVNCESATTNPLVGSIGHSDWYARISRWASCVCRNEGALLAGI